MFYRQLCPYLTTVVVFICAICTTCSQELNHAIPVKTVPFVDVRTQANKINVRDVLSISLFGDSIGRWRTNPLIVTDEILLKNFISALRHATISYDSHAVCVDSIEIHLKQPSTSHPTSVSFLFNAQDEGESFGPEFQSALNALGRYTAWQTRLQIRQNVREVQSIKIDDVITVENANEVNRLLKTLGSIDEYAFSFTNPNTFWVGLSLVLRNGAKIDYRFQIPKPPLCKRPYVTILWKYNGQAIQINKDNAALQKQSHLIRKTD